MQISKKASYLSDKMHLEKVTGKNCIKKTDKRALKKAEPSLFQNILFWVHFVIKVS
jgi:hypothetical protein